jgi:TonB family protein
MKKQRDERERRHSSRDLSRTASGGLLKIGVFSLLLHIALIAFLILNLKTGITKDGSSIFRVTVHPFSSQLNSSKGPIAGLSTHLPLLSKIQIQEEEHKSIENLKQIEPIEEPKILPQQHEEEGTLKEPIPLPMAEGSLDTDSSPKEEDHLPTVLIPPHLREEYKNIISGIGSGEGTGGSGWGGSGNRSGTGQGGSGWGSPGYGGTGGLYPRYVENPKPVYPLEAREKGYQGEVLLRVEILANGRVGQVEVKKSSGYEVLDQSALVAVKKWKFIPARKGEVAIPFWVNIPIKFQLL